jgi:nucleoside-diphosphate-sugar epimerase
MARSDRLFLVTGAQGFLGRYFVDEVLSSLPDSRVLGVGRSPECPGYFTHRLNWCGTNTAAPVPRDIHTTSSERFQYQRLDLCDGSATRDLLRRWRPDVVVHLASGLRGDTIGALTKNIVQGATSLMNALSALDGAMPLVVYASTGGVYGRVPDSLLPIHESTSTAPVDLYAVCKLAAEHCCRVVGQQKGIEVIYARIFNLIGPGQDDRHVGGKFASEVAAIATGELPPIIRTLDLLTTRDFIHARDCARALLTLADEGTGGDIYNVATGDELPVKAILESLIQQAGLQGRIEVQESRICDGRPQRHCGCVNASLL